MYIPFQNKEDMKKAARSLFLKHLKVFLPSKNFSEIGVSEKEITEYLENIELSKEDAKKFLRYLGIKNEYPCLCRDKNPLEDKCFQEDGFNVGYFVENTFGIWCKFK